MTLIFLTSMNTLAGNLSADTLYLRFITWNVEYAPHAITCLTFDDYNGREYCVTSPLTIKSIKKELNTLHKTHKEGFNVGCKLLFVKKGKVRQVIGMDESNVIMNGHYYINTKRLMAMIDSIRRNTTRNRKPFGYKQKKHSSIYYKGNDAFSKRLSVLFNQYKKRENMDGTTRIRVFCWPKTNGKARKSIINVYNKNMAEKQKIELERIIKNWFMHKIRWKKDPTRMNADWIVLWIKVDESLYYYIE